MDFKGTQMKFTKVKNWDSSRPEIMDKLDTVPPRNFKILDSAWNCFGTCLKNSKIENMF